MSQLYKCFFVSGRPTMVQYVNSTTNTISAGTPLLVNGSIWIPHNDIAPGAQGAVAVGGGVYNVDNSGSGVGQTAGATLKLNTSTFTPDYSTNGAKAGESTLSQGSTAATLQFLHQASENA
jgi:hypothetical protein